MGDMHPTLPVKLIVGILTSIPEILPTAEASLAERFGNIDSRSISFPFTWTHYYDKTMGSPIRRCFLGFENLIAPSAIADVKIVTNELESILASQWTQVPRPVNLDPGYIEESKLVLASTKNYYHRILVARGIYAEVTLHFEKGAWHTLPWTFPDFASKSYHEYLMSLRRLYRNQLKRWAIQNGVAQSQPGR